MYIDHMHTLYATKVVFSFLILFRHPTCHIRIVYHFDHYIDHHMTNIISFFMS